jgi:hypothetical protein
MNQGVIVSLIKLRRPQVGMPASQFEFSEQLSAHTYEAMDECVELVDRMVLEERKER